MALAAKRWGPGAGRGLDRVRRGLDRLVFGEFPPAARWLRRERSRLDDPVVRSVGVHPTVEGTNGHAVGRSDRGPTARPDREVLVTQIHWDGGAVTLRVEGEIDAASAERFDQVLSSLPASAHTVCVDLRGVTFFTAAGCGVVARFVNGRGPARRGSVRLLPSDAVHRVLTICDMGDLLP